MQFSVRDGGARLVAREYVAGVGMRHVCSIPLKPAFPADVPQSVAERLANRPKALAEIRARLADMRGLVPARRIEPSPTPVQALVRSMADFVLVAAEGFERYAPALDPAQRAEVVTALLLALHQLGYHAELRRGTQ